MAVHDRYLRTNMSVSFCVLCGIKGILHVLGASDCFRRTLLASDFAKKRSLAAVFFTFFFFASQFYKTTAQEIYPASVSERLFSFSLSLSLSCGVRARSFYRLPSIPEIARTYVCSISSSSSS